MKKIVITGGHLTPALAVIEELKKRENWEIFFIGRKSASEGDPTPSIESKIIPQMGIKFFPLITGRIQRTFTRWTIFSLIKIPIGFFMAFYYLLKIKPQIILSFGGYLSSPVVFAGWLLGIPSITHEQTTVKGLATSFNVLFAKKIAVSWPETINFFPKNKVVLTGNPIRKEIFEINEKKWKMLNFSKNLPLVFITGGNQGSHSINMAIQEILPRLLKIANVFHQCGHLNLFNDFEKLNNLKRRLPPDLTQRYLVKKYIDPSEIGTLLNKADLVICRAGANTISELAALGKPALLIPLPWLYQNEQTQNAYKLAKIGQAEILFQKDLTGENLLNLIKKILKNLSFYQKNGLTGKKLIKLDAAKKIVDLLEELLK